MSFFSGTGMATGFESLTALSGLSVFAYLDPGTGSFVLQLLIAGLLSGLYAARHWWYQIKSLLFQVPAKR